MDGVVGRVCDLDALPPPGRAASRWFVEEAVRQPHRPPVVPTAARPLVVGTPVAVVDPSSDEQRPVPARKRQARPFRRRDGGWPIMAAV